jgi:NitT/TauT family transport system substrate-binding protein
MKRRTFLSGTIVLFPSLFLPLGCAANPAPSAKEVASIVPTNLGFSSLPGSLPWEISRKAKLFHDTQWTVDFKWFDRYEESLAALATGLLDANTQTLVDTVRLANAGVRQTVVLTNSYSMGNHQVIARPSVKQVGDLKGKKIAVLAKSSEHFLLDLGLQKAGLSSRDVEIRSLSNEAAVAAFASGQVDAVAVAAPWTVKARAIQGSQLLWSSADFPGSISTHLAVSQQAIEQSPASIQKAIATWFETLAFIDRKRQRCEESMAERAGVQLADFKQNDREIHLLNLQENRQAFYAEKSIKSLPYVIDKIEKFLLQNGAIESQPDLSKFLDGRFL